jgi:enoyl-CoA hydratase/carnithine racemase
MPYQAIAVDQQTAIPIITLARPEEGNRLDRLMLDELRDAVQQLVDAGASRALILRGSESVFSLGWGAEFLRELRSSARRAIEPDVLGSTFQFLADAPLPVIAAIGGDALSVGFELALACDLRIAAEGARMALPDTAEGRIPMAGGTQRLARLAGRGLATDLILTGRTIGAHEALQAGIVSAVVEPSELLSGALAVANTIAQRGPLAVRLAKEAVARGLDMPLEQALRYETDLTVLLQTTSDRAEGVRAFVEKREPDFHGK